MEQKNRRIAKGPKYLSFDLAMEEYCIDIQRVREILGMPLITPVPQTPDFIRGVMNLRGSIIPVVDLRLKFGLPFREYGDRTCVVVVSVEGSIGKTLMGVVVDTIHEVLPIEDQSVTRLPYINSRIRSEYIKGFSESGNTLRIILNIDQVLEDHEIQVVHTVGLGDMNKGAMHE